MFRVLFRLFAFAVIVFLCCAGASSCTSQTSPSASDAPMITIAELPVVNSR